MDNIDEIISYANTLLEGHIVTSKTRINELLHMIKITKCDFILQNINSEPLVTIIKKLKTERMSCNIKQNLTELLQYIEHYSAEIYAHSTILVCYH